MAGQRLSNADASWLQMDRPKNPMVINAVLLLDEPVALEAIAEVCRSRLVGPYPRFRQRVADGALPLQTPSWVDDSSFELGRHLHHIALPAPGDVAALRDIVADLTTAPLDHSKPLWDTYLIDSVGPGCALMMRMHHCIADGIALVRVLISLTDPTSPDGSADPGFGVPTAQSGRLARAYATANTLAHEGIETFLHPRHLASAIGRDAQTLAKLALSPPDAATPLRGRLSGRRRVAWSQPIALDEVKHLAHARQATVNDVLLAAVSGALRRYLKAHDSPAVELHAIVPFNLRPLDEPIPRDLGNCFGLVLLTLPVDVASPQARLLEVNRRMDAIKHSREGPLSYAILGAVARSGAQLESPLIDLYSAKGSAVMTNIPGPREPVSMAGVPVRTVLVWAPTSGSVGISVSIFSYRSQVTIGLMVDAALVPEPQEIIDELGPELDGLVGLEPSTPLPSGAPRR
jgi:diacylglycerol O-acyltransferase / wax synthase